MKRTLLIAAIFAMTLPAQAHTVEEIEEFEQDWSERVAENDFLTFGLVIEYRDFMERHEWYWKPAPRQRTQTRRSNVSVPGGVEVWRGLVASYFPADQVDRALCIMAAETVPDGNPNSYNPSSGASGLFQHLPKYWSDRSSEAGWAGADIFDPTANVAVAAWLWRQGGWWHWSPYKRGACR